MLIELYGLDFLAQLGAVAIRFSIDVFGLADGRAKPDGRPTISHHEYAAASWRDLHMTAGGE